MNEIKEWYIRPEADEKGWYGCAQNPGWPEAIMIPAGELFDKFCEYNGYVFLTVEDKVVTDVKVNQEAWDAYKEWVDNLPPPPDPDEPMYEKQANAIKSEISL